MESIPPILAKPPTPAKIKKRNRRIFIFLIVGFVIVLLLGISFFRKRDPVITVQTEKVARHDITEIVVANGKIQPVVEVHISPEVSGEIIALPVKEGQKVKKGDLLLKIKPDFYIAAMKQAEANYESSLAAADSATASLEKADADFQRNKELFARKLISESDYIGFKVARDVARAQLESATNQVNMAKASVDSAKDSLDKTTIVSPINGTISQLNSQLGERVLGTVENAGTDIMTISDLNNMEARVNVGEMDVVLIQPGQKAKLEVDSFHDKKFTGIVTDISNSSGANSRSVASLASSAQNSSGDVTQFQVRIHVNEQEFFRPGMSVTANIETRYRTNVIGIPIACVTTRLPKDKSKPAGDAKTNSISSATTNTNSAGKKSDDKKGPTEVVFVVNGDRTKMVPVKIGINDDNYWEITDGLTGGEEIVTGSYRAISRDLEDGKRIKKGLAGFDVEKTP
ncbi:MAG TPA: efflux RND transporter periplasmic adaptor subunit [Verrucomicrobiae bacterium]|nr:efflux RND transporter periplasmic adaptor subunit [Verrucomicrobiae bacterium]